MTRQIRGAVTAFALLTASIVPAARAQDPVAPFGDLMVTQIAFVVRDADAAARRWGALLGVDVPPAIVTDPLERARTQFRGQPSEARAKIAFVRLKNLTIELIEPIGGPSTWQEHLENHGEGVHHLAFDVKDMPAAIAHAEAHGGATLQRGDFTGGSYHYLEMPAPYHVILELLAFERDR